MVGVRVEDADNVQPLPGGLLLAAQHLARGEQVAVVAGARFAGIAQRQDRNHLAPVAFRAPQQQPGAFLRVGGFAVGVDLNQQ